MRNQLRFIGLMILGLFVSVSVCAQTGKLTIHQSPAVESLVKKHKVINKEKPKMQGYRLQIYSVSGVGSKEKAQEVLEKFQESYPNAPVYIVYKAPYFSVRIGNFRSQIEALYFLQSIVSDYPHGFPVIDYIEYPSFE